MDSKNMVNLLLDIEEPLPSWNDTMGEPELEFDDTEIESSLICSDINQQDQLLNYKENDHNLESNNIETLQFFEENFEDQLSFKASNDEALYPKESIYKDIEDLNIINIAGDDKVGRKIIIISACNLPTKEKFDYNRFQNFIIHTLDKFVESDYTLVYFHYGLNCNKPSISWLWQAYKMFDRKYKKNLKQLYLVHPTNFIKILYQVFKPVISTKFGEKIIHINDLTELKRQLQTDKLYIPEQVLEYERKLHIPSKNSRMVYNNINKSMYPSTQLFGIDISELNKRYNDPIPPQIKHIIEILSTDERIDTEGIFRRSCNTKRHEAMKYQLNHGQFVTKDDEKDVHLLSMILKSFLRELPLPILTFELYDKIVATDITLVTSSFCQEVVAILPELNRIFLSHVLKFLNKVAAHCLTNKMDSINLGVVFGPNLIWSKAQPSLHSIEHINYFVSILINNYEIIFEPI